MSGSDIVRTTRGQAVNSNQIPLIRVSVDGQEAMDRAVRLLSGIQSGIEKALDSAAKSATSRMRKASVKAVRERYAIKAASVRENENVQVTYTYNSGVQATVRFAGRRIPLYRFDGATPSQPTRDTSGRLPVMTGEDHWRLVYPSVPAAGHVLKGTSPTRFESAFVARMPNGHVGIYERTGGRTSGGKDEIEELFGPSVPQMLGNETVARALVQETVQSFEKDLNHSVMAILSGYLR